MENKKIEKNLSSAVEKLIPEDMYSRVEQSIALDKERTKLMKNTKKHFSFKLVAAIAACLVLVLGIGGVGYYRNFEVASVVDIDVNPSVEISVNRRDRVINVYAVNSDGADLLDGMDLKNVDLDVAVNAIVGAMVKNGYFSSGDGQILVTVKSDDAAKAGEIRSLVVSDIDAALKANSAGASILNQTISVDNGAESLAKEKGISIGKAVFVLNLAALSEGLDAATLADMSLTELTEVVKTNGIDIGRIVDYDADDSLFENIKDGIEDANEANAKVILTPAEAKATALAAAGVTEADASFIKVKLERDDGRAYYDIEFRAGNTVYDFEINAETGAIEEKETEKDKTATTASEVKLTLEEAKAKAFAHAGVNAADVRILHTELDRDDGAWTYEIEFVAGNAVYEYEIGATDGQVRDFEREEKRVPASTQAPVTDAPSPSVSGTEQLITAEEAENIALAHAGLARADVRFEKTELDKDDGKTVYEVGFKKDGVEYDYEIDAASGKIVEADVEKD